MHAPAAAPAFTSPAPLSIRRSSTLLNRRLRSVPMAQQTPPSGFNRITIPLVADILTVSNPALMKKIVEHPSIARPQQTKNPSAFNAAISATQFFSRTDREYALAFQSTGVDDQPQRRERVFRNLAERFTDAQIATLAELVRSDQPQYILARKMFQTVGHVVSPLNEGQAPPDEILDAMEDMNLANLVTGYFAARRARKLLETWVKQSFPEEKHPVDVMHDMATLYQGFSLGLVTLRKMETEGATDVESFLTKNPILPVSLRTVRSTTDIDGVFKDNPLVQDKTIVVLMNGEAAIESGNDHYVWGLGSEERLCPFRQVFYDAAERIRKTGKQ